MQHMHFKAICKKKRRSMHLKKNKALDNFSNNLEQEKPDVARAVLFSALEFYFWFARNRCKICY
jgi:hypothetical protein